MAAKPGNRKAELIAIYRLEFYKKKNNWKLSHDQPKTEEIKPTTPPKSVNLNKTYDIVVEPEPDVQDVSVLNQAFVETGSDHNLQAVEPEQVCSQRDWCEEPERLEPDVWPMEHQKCLQSPMYGVSAEVGYSPGWPSSAQQCPSPVQQWPSLAHQWPTSAPQWPSTAPQWPSAQQWPSSAQQWPVSQQWASSDQPWAGDGQLVSDCVDGPSEAESPSRLVSLAEAWLEASAEAPSSGGLAEDSGSGGLEDSLEQFMRGAHEAPHSSEMDLHSSPGFPSSPWSLSGRQLAVGLTRHAAALRDLLSEARLRDEHKMQASFEQSPLIARLALEAPPAPPHDFIAGSFRGGELGVEMGGGGDEWGARWGRGRGRREPLIGIGRGRPYRL